MLNEDKLFNIGMNNKDDIEPILMDLYNADWKSGIKLFLSALNHYSKLANGGVDDQRTNFAQKYMNLFCKSFH